MRLSGIGGVGLIRFKPRLGLLGTLGPSTRIIYTKRSHVNIVNVCGLCIKLFNCFIFNYLAGFMCIVLQWRRNQC